MIGQTQAQQAAAQGFLFGMSELQFGSRCFGATGQNKGTGMFCD